MLARASFCTPCIETRGSIVETSTDPLCVSRTSTRFIGEFPGLTFAEILFKRAMLRFTTGCRNKATGDQYMQIVHVKVKLLWAVSLFMTLSIGAEGMGQGKGLKMGGPCREDRMKHCSHAMGDHSGMLQCMNDHEKDLSNACRDHKNAMNADMKSAHAACMPDIEKFCADVKPGQGRMRDCLRKNKAGLSQTCKDAHKNIQ